jgi:CheY-like chemotaxis protein
MARLLKFSGHEVRVAHDGEDAIRIAREHRPEVMLLDIGLPGMDGYELATTLRGEEWSKDSVLIAVSGYGEEQARDRSKEAGFHQHLVKPVNFDTILALLGG